jgi:large repetitive protein
LHKARSMASKSYTILLVALLVGLLAVAPASGAPAAPTGLAVSDLVSDPEVFDPQFSWAAVSGAVGYQVEVNSSSFWASDSKVCCSNISISVPMTTYGTEYSPPVVLANNNGYYWRVRAIDSNGNAGPWAAGSSFQKAFANAPSTPAPVVKNLRLVDPNLATLAAGSVTSTPIVLWDAVPGASSYRVVVAPFTSGACNWSASGSVRWERDTATTGWTPLGWNRGTNADPLGADESPSSDLITHLTANEDYCVRVRPIDRASTSAGPVILGDWTYLPANNQAAFTWPGPPAVASCDPCAMTAGDYLRPAGGATVGSMPVFTWSPIPGAQSYFVVVARDPSFTTITDYAWTRVPAYAPRTNSLTVGYGDETSNYYWAVLPAQEANGYGVSADPASSDPQAFVKQSTQPPIVGPTGGVLVNGAATVFHWSPVLGARRYRLQVAEEPTFVNIIREGSSTTGAVTDSTAYTSNTAYPEGKTLYWRVQAEGENGSGFVGLRWSSTETFSKPAGSGSSGSTIQKFKLSAKGYPVKNRSRYVTVYVKNSTSLAAIAGASVRVSGAGVAIRTKTTGTGGAAKFYLKATRYPGTVTFKVSKAGYTTAYLYRKVRLP